VPVIAALARGPRPSAFRMSRLVRARPLGQVIQRTACEFPRAERAEVTQLPGHAEMLQAAIADLHDEAQSPEATG
jgi:hypothetical protein